MTSLDTNIEHSDFIKKRGGEGGGGGDRKKRLAWRKLMQMCFKYVGPDADQEMSDWLKNKREK